MIAKLTGRVDTLGNNWVLIDVQGVGYRALCSRKTLDSLQQEGQVISLYTEMIVRQDMIQLYGFSDALERDWFNLLTIVQGVGMKVALALLSALSVKELSQALLTQDPIPLTRADGVGRKLADRIVNELKDKHKFIDLSGVEVANLNNKHSRIEEAISALMNLGYKRPEAVEAVSQVCHGKQTIPPLEEIIRNGLSQLARA